MNNTTVLVYSPYTFNGQGPGASCANIVANLTHGLKAEVFAARVRTRVPGPVTLLPSLTSPLRHLPWGLVRRRALAKLNLDFANALDRANPTRTVAYFWPDPPIDLVRHARSLGIPTIREMTNTACATSSEILNDAHLKHGLSSRRPIAEEKIATEIREIQYYDFIFASNIEVEKSLSRLGIPRETILRTTFGWDPKRFADSAILESSTAPCFIFAGTLSVRKGIPDLLDAWRLANVDGELVLAGSPEAPEIARIVQAQSRSARVRAVGHVHDLGPLLRSADVFIFPTLEEGGPQVTYEAAGCGLPIITTPMGAARLVSQGVNGIIVEPGSVPQLTDSIRLLASRPDLRAQYGQVAQRDAERFTYERVGAQRSELITEALRIFRGKSAPQ